MSKSTAWIFRVLALAGFGFPFAWWIDTAIVLVCWLLIDLAREDWERKRPVDP